MRLPKRGERGFTLIELLIVVAILGVLAAVVIPNVTRFVGAGKEEAAETELHNIQLAVTSMMLENGLTTIPAPIDETGAVAENDMGAFPDFTSSNIIPAPDGGKLTDPEGFPYVDATDDPGYVLFGHDIYGTTNPKHIALEPNINYVTVQMTTYYYTCEADGTVQQWSTATGW